MSVRLSVCLSDLVLCDLVSDYKQLSSESLKHVYGNCTNAACILSKHSN